MADVFISYKREDRERVLPIARLLSALGVEVWMDVRLEPGRKFDRVIDDELQKCRAQIVCWSRASVQSDWVRSEAEVGRQRGVLVPVLIEPCRATPPFNLLHAEDLTGWYGEPTHLGWRKVLGSVSRLVGKRIHDAFLDDDAQVWPAASPIPVDAIPQMVAIPAGRFLMGSPDAELLRSRNESPQHEVRVSAFELGKFTVTMAQWDAAIAAGAALPKLRDNGWGRGELPAIWVSWRSAQLYLAWLNSRTDGGYRLPTEAEWEYACRAGTTTPFSFGETISTEQANFDGSTAYGSGKAGSVRGRTTPVGMFPPNGFGLHDMHGNVYQWVQDDWCENYTHAPNDGTAWLDEYPDPKRALRGSCYEDGPSAVRSAARQYYWAMDLRGVGLRVARTVRPVLP